MTMPRPDLACLGIRHRRIPVLAIGRDVYLDTRLMLRKLEQITAPSVRPPLGVRAGTAPELQALERLFNVLTIDSGLFLDSARLIPADTSTMRDPAFSKDRLDFFGGPLHPRVPKKDGSAAPTGSPTPPTPVIPAPAATYALSRAEALAEVRHAALLLETTLLADGRDWILGTASPNRAGPSLADIEAIWTFHWLTTMPGALTDGSGSGASDAGLTPAQFPRLFAWLARFSAAVKAARKAEAHNVTAVDGAAAALLIQAAPYFEPAGSTADVDASDPVVRTAGLRAGQRVVLWPTDTGVAHKDVGRLVRLGPEEVVLEVLAASDAGKAGAPSVLLHAPRHGFRVRALDEAADEAADVPKL